MKAVRRFALGLFTVAALAACGGGGGGSGPVATAVVPASAPPISINTATGPVLVQALAGTTVRFPAAISFRTGAGTTVTSTGPTQVTFGVTAGAPSFTLQDANGTITGDLGFGSCLFTVRSITGVVPGFVVGDTFTVTPCSIDLPDNLPADGNTGRNPSVTVVFGTVSSEPVPVGIAVSSSGDVLVSTPTGTVTVPQVKFTPVVVTGAI